jgi:hypothetical protein
MNDNKNNLLIKFCFEECKFCNTGCNLPEVNELAYCPAEHFADWMSEMFIQPDYRERKYSK